MEHNEDLARLEQFVEKLVASYNELKNENNEMMAQLQAKQAEIDELQEVVRSLQKDRNVMHNQVTGLIDRIDEWQKIFEQEEPLDKAEPGEGRSQKLSKKGSSLFNVGSGQSSESALR